MTPNEQMSLQHRRELEASGQTARLFSDRARSELFQYVEIIDLNKLAEQKGIKRVAVSDFGDNNLVLVDEGHLGASGKVWRKRRRELARGGFTFEYSATFNQVAGKDPEMMKTYRKCLLFDYAYRLFHRDGYGKDYAISNLREEPGEQSGNMYLLGCLLTFYQQYRIWQDRGAGWQDFNIARPLWVFLGKTVIGKSRADSETTSDVVRILEFLGWVMAEADRVRGMLKELLRGASGLHDEAGGDYFHGRFEYLAKCGAGDLYADICRALFGGAGHLRAIYLTAGEGEMHLRCADNPVFGVVNVGDATRLFKRLAERKNPQIAIEREAGFARRLFADLDRPDSTVNIVIGARRFIAGWNSWRVSTMGLMRVGVNEGPEIIQMFGRGVRLRGWNASLKRHQKSGAAVPPDSRELAELETLHIFGLRANYMQTFKELMEKEGVDVQMETITLPVIWNFARQADLKIIRIRGGQKYRQSAERPVIRGPEDSGDPIVLDRYSALQNVASNKAGGDEEAPKTEVDLEPRHTDFFDRAHIYAQLLERKRRKGWHNMVIERDAVDRFLEQTSWYVLRMPREHLDGMRDFQSLRGLQEVAVELMAAYAERFWRRHRSKWEQEHFEVVQLDKDNPAIVGKYELSASAKEEQLLRDLRSLQEELARTTENLPAHQYAGVGAIMSDNHAYKPLLYALKDCLATIRPVALNMHERRAVERLTELARNRDACLQGCELYLLRNLSRGRGVSFFDDFHYYPDFILWLKKGARQHVIFLDPKGLSRYGDKERRKVRLHRDIKQIEQKIREQDANITLHAYILSVTNPEDIGEQRRLEDWHKDGVYFLNQKNFMQDIIRSALNS